MGIFNRGVSKAAVSPAPEPSVKAAAAGSGYGTYGGYTSQRQGITQQRSRACTAAAAAT